MGRLEDAKNILKYFANYDRLKDKKKHSPDDIDHSDWVNKFILKNVYKDPNEFVAKPREHHNFFRQMTVGEKGKHIDGDLLSKYLLKFDNTHEHDHPIVETAPGVT